MNSFLPELKESREQGIYHDQGLLATNDRFQVDHHAVREAVGNGACKTCGKQAKLGNQQLVQSVFGLVMIWRSP